VSSAVFGSRESVRGFGVRSERWVLSTLGAWVCGCPEPGSELLLQARMGMCLTHSLTTLVGSTGWPRTLRGGPTTSVFLTRLPSRRHEQRSAGSPASWTLMCFRRRVRCEHGQPMADQIASIWSSKTAQSSQPQCSRTDPKRVSPFAGPGYHGGESVAIEMGRAVV
jgi:hypothetical protein